MIIYIYHYNKFISSHYFVNHPYLQKELEHRWLGVVMFDRNKFLLYEDDFLMVLGERSLKEQRLDKQ